MVAPLPGGVAGGQQADIVAADQDVGHAVKNGIARLGSLFQFAVGAFLQNGQRFRGYLTGDVVFAQDLQAVGKGGVVGAGQAGSDGVEAVTNYVGKDKAEAAGRGDGPRQATTLDVRQVFADGVDFVDSGAAGQQGAGDLLLVGQAEALHPVVALERAGQQGGAATGYEMNDQSFFVRGGGHLQHALAGQDAVVVRYGMAGLQGFNMVERFGVTVLDGDESPIDAFTEDLLESQSHLGRRLARPHDIELPVVAEVDLEKIVLDIDGQQAAI